MRASFQTGVNNMIKLDMHRTRITALREADFFIFRVFHHFFLIPRSLIRKFILGFSCVRASFQTGVNNMIKLDMHRTRITALREALFFVFPDVLQISLEHFLSNRVRLTPHSILVTAQRT